MTQLEQPTVLFVGNDPALEYLLNRYAQRSGCQIQTDRGHSQAADADHVAVDMAAQVPLDMAALRPLSVWFSSLDVLEASQALRAAAASLDIPLVVCAAVADHARALELGADYSFLHPVTYDYFVSTLGAAHVPMGDE
jgi:CheY-like chemotaxis protein